MVLLEYSAIYLCVLKCQVCRFNTKCVCDYQAPVWRQPDCSESCRELWPIRHAAESPGGPHFAPLRPTGHTHTRLDTHAKDADPPGSVGGEPPNYKLRRQPPPLRRRWSLSLSPGGSDGGGGVAVVSVLPAAGGGVLPRAHGAAGNLRPGGPVLPSAACLQTPAVGAVCPPCSLPLPGLQPSDLLHPRHPARTQGAPFVWGQLPFVIIPSSPSFCDFVRGWVQHKRWWRSDGSKWVCSCRSFLIQTERYFPKD